MDTKKVHYWIDLPPNWDKKREVPHPYIPYLNTDCPQFEVPEGFKRIRVSVEFPVFGEEGDLVLAESKEIKGGFSE